MTHLSCPSCPCVLFCHQLLQQLGRTYLWRNSELALYSFKILPYGSTLCNWAHNSVLNCILYKWHLATFILPCRIIFLVISDWIFWSDRLWGTQSTSAQIDLLSSFSVVVTSEGWNILDATYQVVPSFKTTMKWDHNNNCMQ
jgi:hypothetical protein